MTNNGVPTQYGVLLFETNVIAGVDRAQLLPDSPDSVTNKVPFFSWPSRNHLTNGAVCPALTIPCVACCQQKDAYSADWWDVNANLVGWDVNGDLGYLYPSLWLPNWTRTITGGDSGHPVYALIQNQLVLQGVWYGYATCNTNVLLTGWCRPALVNAAIAAIDLQVLGVGHTTGEAVSVIDLSAFPDSTGCSGPDIVTCP